MSEDPDVSGRHALTIAHLLAELLENATHFSNPDTRVVVSASVTGHGVDVTVTDYGLGMSPEEIADANEKIAHPPVAEIAVSQRLGLFVVGRLASRLGATVELRRGRAAGTVVAVALPSSVFEGFAQPVAEDEDVLAPVFEAAPVEDVDALLVPADEEPADELVSEPVETAEPARKGLLRRGRRRAPAAARGAPLRWPRLRSSRSPSRLLRSTRSSSCADTEVEEPVAELVAEVEVAEAEVAADVDVEHSRVTEDVEVETTEVAETEAVVDADPTEPAVTRPARKGLFRRGHRRGRRRARHCRCRCRRRR